MPTTLNLIEEKVGNTLERIGTGNHFINITPAAQALRETINKWDFLKLKSFCKAKDTVNKTKRQPTEWEKIFTNPTIRQRADLQNKQRTQEIESHQKNK
ncbi:hypothetical protein ACRRTK_017261 [Alexandromys fortis]